MSSNLAHSTTIKKEFGKFVGAYLTSRHYPLYSDKFKKSLDKTFKEYKSILEKEGAESFVEKLTSDSQQGNNMAKLIIKKLDLKKDISSQEQITR